MCSFRTFNTIYENAAAPSPPSFDTAAQSPSESGTLRVLTEYHCLLRTMVNGAVELQRFEAALVLHPFTALSGRPHHKARRRLLNRRE